MATQEQAVSVLTIGGAMIDTIVQIAPERIEHMKMANAESSFLLVEEGRKVEAQSIEQFIGGGAVNAAVSMARQGGAVATLVKLGRDLNAEKVLERLRAEGIDEAHIARTDRLGTGASVLLSSHENNAGIFTARGANTLLDGADLPDAAFACDMVYVTGLSNESADQFPVILRKARAAGAFVACNPGIRQLSSRAQPFFENLPNIDLLLVNRVEAAQMVPGLIGRGYDAGTNLTDESATHPMLAQGLAAGGFQMSFTAFARAVIDCGPARVVVTDGGRGAYAASADGITHCGIVKVQVAGTAGAGDAFASTLSLGLARGLDLNTALERASRNAASVLEHVDTQTGLLNSTTLNSRMTASSALTSHIKYAV